MSVINICYHCLTGKPGNVFFKTEKNNVFKCEKCTDNDEHKYCNISLEEALKLRDEYLNYISKIKLNDESKIKIKEILNNKISEFN